MMMCPMMGLLSLIAATALLIWVSGKDGNPAQKFGKAIAWIAIVLSGLMLIGQMAMCSKMCMKGQCMRGMGGMPMMQQMGGMPPPPPPAGAPVPGK